MSISSTGILPSVVAETVLNQNGIDCKTIDGQWFVRHVETRTNHCYTHNATFRKSLNKDKGRDILYAFVQHWLDAFQNDPEQYVRRHTLALVADELQS